VPPLGSGDALVVVDVQNDFLPGGSLGVPHGDEVIPVLNRWIARARERNVPVFATRDYHPPDHCSFRERGGPWPPHCVQGTPGAELAPGLEVPPEAVVHKAMDRDREAYSGFDGTDLDARLRAQKVRRLFVGGLATDYCVLNTVKDARRLGYDVVLLESAVRPVEVRPGDGARAIAEMKELGATVLSEAP